MEYPDSGASRVYLSDFANEILLHIFYSLPSIRDCLSLGATNRHLHSLLLSSHRLSILYDAAEAEYGPLSEAKRLISHNSSQAPHVPRPMPAHSFALLKQIIEVGRVANKWVALYPSKKWRGEEASARRFLTNFEQYKLRRACYRVWLYTLAFHTPACSRNSRKAPQIIHSRAALLRPWNPTQLAELLDVQAMFRQVLQSTICPSNSTVIRRHKTRFPNDPLPLYAVTQPRRWAHEHAFFQHRTHFHTTPHTSNLLSSYSKSSNSYGMAIEGWGDEIAHYYVVEDMMKLDPGQLMYLFQHITDMLGPTAGFNAGWSSKAFVESFLASTGGDWFENNGETLGETIGFVVGERGGDGIALREAVEDGLEGIVKTEEVLEYNIHED